MAKKLPNPGLVSNCWRHQLRQGTPLDELITEAGRRGCRLIELRQSCLGEYERPDDHLPLAGPLGALPERFPGLRFNLAVCVPFLNPGFSADSPLFTAGKWAARAVAGEFPPHLRLVDLLTSADEFLQHDSEQLAANLAALTRALIEIDGLLSLEHSIQPWRPFLNLFRAARGRLGPDADRLRLCYDPCNLLLPGFGGVGADPAEVTPSLDINEISMLHVKQRRGGRPLPVVDDGDVDWSEQLRILAEKHYAGPALFEIESTPEIWTNLQASTEYLQSLT